MRKKTHIRSDWSRSEKTNFGIEPHLKINGCSSTVLATLRPLTHHIGEHLTTIVTPSKTNIHKGKIHTPHTDSCLHGFSRELAIKLCRQLDIPAKEKNSSMAKTYDASEAFPAGKKGALTPLIEIDDRKIINCSELKVYDHIVKHFKRSNPTTLKKITF
jgi:hypothetical protein